MKKAIKVETPKKRRKYDDAFKQQALQMMRLGQSVPSIALALGVGESLLYKWKQALQPAAQDQELEHVCPVKAGVFSGRRNSPTRGKVRTR